MSSGPLWKKKDEITCFNIEGGLFFVWLKHCLQTKYYRKMMINQDTACMFARCYDSKGGHFPAHSAKPAIFPYVIVETDFASFFLGRERENLAQL